MSAGIEYRRLAPEWCEPLTSFFQAITAAGDDRYFHPHPFTAAEAERLATYVGRDLYYVLIEDHMVLAYGMLRGWDDGYRIPSLGIAVHPAMRGQGLATATMQFLHLAARRQGAPAVRLTVYVQNRAAVNLYRAMGYEFQAPDDMRLVGTKPL